MREAPGGEGAYEVVGFGNLWSGLSILCALLALYSRKWISLLPWQLQGYYLMPPLAVLIVPPLSALGLVSGFMATRRSSGGLLPRIGFVLNLVIFALSSLIVVAVWLWRRSVSD